MSRFSFLCISFLISSFSLLFSNESEIYYEESLFSSAKSIKYQPYVRNPYVSDEVWDTVSRYFLPVDHPLREELDEIFSESRVVEDEDSMAAAGFKLTKQQGLHVVATKHKKLKGFVIKMYPDFKSPEEEWIKWIQRIEGAELIRKTIKQFNYKPYFTVAKKWIYPLPATPAPKIAPGYYPKHFVLVVEDLDLADPDTNRAQYRFAVTPELLEQIYTMTELLGLADSLRISNLSWTKDGKLAFVDTEAFNRWPVKYHPLTEYLSHTNRKYWKQITKNARKTIIVK